MPKGGVLDIDLASAERRILKFIREVVKGAGAKGVVVGLSGGVDSAVAGALCVKAIGKEKVTVLLMPSDFTPAADLADAHELVTKWGVRAFEFNISRAAEQLTGAFGFESDKIARANVQARVRMILNYLTANSFGLLVAGTGDKSEESLGYFSKFGDGGADFLPIAHLYKTQIRQLGSRLGLPDKVVNKPASPQLWPGHKASDELPADYDRLDPLLYYLFDKKLSPPAAAKKAGLPLQLAKTVVRMSKNSAHKRALPPSLVRE